MTAAALLTAAKAKGLMLATAESCTGGLLSAAITDIPGTSAIFDRAFVTYTNAAKIEMLGVQHATLGAYGAVSEQVAQQMAQGALHHSNADIAVSITGIAGPGGSERKPEGRVCFGVATRVGHSTETIEFGALGRANVRDAARNHGIALFLKTIGSL